MKSSNFVLSICISQWPFCATVTSTSEEKPYMPIFFVNILSAGDGGGEGRGPHNFGLGTRLNPPRNIHSLPPTGRNQSLPSRNYVLTTGRINSMMGDISQRSVWFSQQTARLYVRRCLCSDWTIKRILIEGGVGGEGVAHPDRGRGGGRRGVLYTTYLRPKGS